MEMGVQLLRHLEGRGALINDRSWRGNGFGKLVEEGIAVAYDGCVFSLMCSYEDVFVRRESGNKGNYHRLCDYLREQALA